MIPERKAFIMLLVVGLCLLAGPGSARDISNGDTVFDYEVVTLNAEFGAPGPYDRLAIYSDDDRTQDPVFSIPVPPGNGSKTLDLEAIDLQGHYGAYYPVYTESTDEESFGYPRIYIREPEVSLGVVLNSSRSDSIVGKTVSPESQIAFKINTRVGFALGNEAAVRIELTTPAGDKVTRIGSLDLSTVPIEERSIWYIPVPPEDLQTTGLGTYTAQVSWVSPSGFARYAGKSNTVEFTIADIPLEIEADREHVSMDKDFYVTIRGDSKKPCYLYVRDAGIPADQYPCIKTWQPGVTLLEEDETFESLGIGTDDAAAALADSERAADGGTYPDGTAAKVQTTAGGTRTIAFTAPSTTEDRAYTITVVDPNNSSRYDEVTVTVEASEFTIITRDGGSCHFGGEITFSGTNAKSDTVYLFMTGPGLDAGGVSLIDPDRPASDGNYLALDVGDDNTWTYRWDTSPFIMRLDEGSYKVWATSAATDAAGNSVDVDHLDGVSSDSIPIGLRVDGLYATPTETTIHPGETLQIDGRAECHPSELRVWTFGDDRRVMETIDGGEWWTYTLDPENTSTLLGDYYVVFQRPSYEYGDEIGYNVWLLHPEDPSDYRVAVGYEENVTDLSTYSPKDAAQFVADAISNEGWDRAVCQVSFSVEIERYLEFDPFVLRSHGPITDGTVQLRGKTNYPAGTLLDWTVTGYDATDVLSSGTAEVTSVSSDAWGFDLDLSTLEEGNYTATVSSPDRSLEDSLNFTLFGGAETAYPESGTYGIRYAFVYPALAEPFAGREDTKTFTSLLTLVPKDREGSAFASEEALQIQTRGTAYPPRSIHYTITADGDVITSKYEDRIATIKGEDLISPTGAEIEVHLRTTCIVQNPASRPSLPEEDGITRFTFLKIMHLDQNGTVVPGSAFTIEQGAVTKWMLIDELALSEGWNFVSVPRALAAGNNTATIFSTVNASGHSGFRYDAAKSAWVALEPTDFIAPLEGFWIYSDEATTVPLTFSTSTPAARTLSKGWNAVGFTGAVPARVDETAVVSAGGGGGGSPSSPVYGWPVSARDALLAVNGEWTSLVGFDAEEQDFEAPVANDEDTGSSLVYPNQGYWLEMTGPGTLSADGRWY